MIIDTDVVTSKSVQVNYDEKMKSGVDKVPNKKGRETLSNLPEHLVGNEILPEHILKKTGELFSEPEREETSTSKVFLRYHVPPEVRVRSKVQE